MFAISECQTEFSRSASELLTIKTNRLPQLKKVSFAMTTTNYVKIILEQRRKAKRNHNFPYVAIISFIILF